jgi:hypothetical protein
LRAEAEAVQRVRLPEPCEAIAALARPTDSHACGAGCGTGESASFDLVWAVNLRRRDFHFLQSRFIAAATRWKTLEFVLPRA